MKKSNGCILNYMILKSLWISADSDPKQKPSLSAHSLPPQSTRCHRTMEKEEEEAIEMERNWADLPPQLFPVILKKLPDISDFVGSRAVCKPWRLSSSVSDLLPQFPWILKRSEGPNLELYSIYFNKVYTIRARFSSGKRHFGPAGGYLLTGQESNAHSFSLLNPLNNTNTELPLPVLHDCNQYTSPESFSCNIPPSFQIDDYMLISVPERSFVCKPGDDRWDIIGPGHEYQYRCYYYKGLLFRVECCTAVTKVMDISKELYVIPPPKHEKLSKTSLLGPFLVESLGEILSLFYNPNKTMDYKFYIYRLEFDNGKGNPCWVKLSSIGDRILFLEIPLGFGRSFCLRASDFAGFKGNCIYFINILPAFPVHVINMYDIETGEIVCIDTPFDQKYHITWFMPTLNHI